MPIVYKRVRILHFAFSVHFSYFLLRTFLCSSCSYRLSLRSFFLECDTRKPSFPFSHRFYPIKNLAPQLPLLMLPFCSWALFEKSPSTVSPHLVCLFQSLSIYLFMFSSLSSSSSYAIISIGCNSILFCIDVFPWNLYDLLHSFLFRLFWLFFMSFAFSLSFVTHRVSFWHTTQAPAWSDPIKAWYCSA